VFYFDLYATSFCMLLPSGLSHSFGRGFISRGCCYVWSYLRVLLNTILEFL